MHKISDAKLEMLQARLGEAFAYMNQNGFTAMPVTIDFNGRTVETLALGVERQHPDEPGVTGSVPMLFLLTEEILGKVNIANVPDEDRIGTTLTKLDEFGKEIDEIDAEVLNAFGFETKTQH